MKVLRTFFNWSPGRASKKAIQIFISIVLFSTILELITDQKGFLQYPLKRLVLIFIIAFFAGIYGYWIENKRANTGK
jgi:hypothetical protein